MNVKFKLDLQLFGGEGAAGDGGGEGAATGVGGEGAAAPVPEEQRLRELGVPDHVLKKRANRKSAKSAGGNAQAAATTQTEVPQAAAAAQPTETEAISDTDAAPAASPRMTWDEIMADPEYNKQMQATVQQRLRSAKGAEENLGKLAPAIELLANKYGMDVNNMDYEALAKAIGDDDQYYEDKALEMGVSVETAKRIDQQERANARQQAQQQQTLEQQKFRDHIASLEQQAAQMKQTFPNFDLKKELRDPRFARMTSPSGGLSVEDAYYAIHRKEIQTAGMQVTAQQTAKKMSNAIQSGQRRPVENGVSGKAASVTSFDYRNAPKQQRDALKKEIYAAAARGEKLYPGQK